MKIPDLFKNKKYLVVLAIVAMVLLGKMLPPSNNTDYVSTAGSNSPVNLGTYIFVNIDFKSSSQNLISIIAKELKKMILKKTEAYLQTLNKF